MFLLPIERSHIPDDFEQLWRKVTEETGVYPVSYIKVENANIISMTLPSPTRRSTTNVLTTVEQKMKSNSNFVEERASLHDAPVSSGGSDVSHEVTQISK